LPLNHSLKHEAIFLNGPAAPRWQKSRCIKKRETTQSTLTRPDRITHAGKHSAACQVIKKN
jgi:hypothetical protein